jgi:exopolysaccharide production protein ExoZ
VQQDRLPGLQVARALAALSIAYFHSWVALTRFPKGTAYQLPILTSHGGLAVDVFFAISGFVICLVVSKPAFGRVPFLTKRAFRLYPLWITTLTAFAILALTWRKPTETETFGYFVYSATLLPTENFPFYDIGWSLQHEMLFYLLAALVVPFIGILGLAIMLAAVTLLSHLIEMPWVFSNLATYYPEFLAGVLAFALRPRLARFGPVVPLILGAIGLWYFMAVWGGRPYIPVALFFLILGFVGIRESGWTRPFVAAGDASYSIYLIHPIVFLVASALVSKLSPPIWSEEPIRIACFAIILAVSLFSFRYFETPMIRFGNGLARRLDRAQDRAITLVPLD